MLGALGIFKAVPLWAWALAAVLAWGAYHRYTGRAAVQSLKTATAVAEAQHEAKVILDEAETKRRIDAQQESARVAQKAADAARADAVTARAAAAELRARRDQAEAERRTQDPAAGQHCQADAARARVYSDLFLEAQDTAVILAFEADRSRAAGEQCERDYQALTR